MMCENAIEATGLCRRFGEHLVLDGVDLNVPAGQVFALLGPNGAGKTTTVRILATLLNPSCGQARVAGFDVVRERRQVRRRISLTGQYAALDEMQTGRENLVMIGRLHQLDRRAARSRAAEMLERFDLVAAADRQVRTYSGGMRRRLDIAAGLIGSPTVVFLDEPTTGLDPRSRQTMWEVIRGLAASGVAVLLTTQYLDEADALAARIAVIDHGRVVAEGSARELKRRVAGERLELELADVDAFDELMRAVDDRATRSERTSLGISIPVQGGAWEVRALLDRLDPDRERIVRFSLREASLDDVFMTLTGQQPQAPESEVAHA
jgi:ABC-2 type transport system ATP-binding protein